MPPKPWVQVAIAVLIRNGKTLICRRPKDAHLPQLWEFPGGKRDPGESWEACLRRELREELGVLIRNPVPIWSRRFIYPDRKVWLRAWRCAIARGKPKPHAATDMRWVPLASLAGYAFPQANAPLIAKLVGADAAGCENARHTL